MRARLWCLCGLDVGHHHWGLYSTPIESTLSIADSEHARVFLVCQNRLVSATGARLLLKRRNVLLLIAVLSTRLRNALLLLVLVVVVDRGIRR